MISRNVDPGQTVASSMNAPTLFVIAADLTKMQVVANIDESDVGKMRPGQTVSFRVDAYPTDKFLGAVQQVRLQPAVVQNVVVYSTVIAVPNPQLKLKPGMTATVGHRDRAPRTTCCACRPRRSASGRPRRCSRCSTSPCPRKCCAAPAASADAAATVAAVDVTAARGQGGPAVGGGTAALDLVARRLRRAAPRRPHRQPQRPAQPRPQPAPQAQAAQPPAGGGRPAPAEARGGGDRMAANPGGGEGGGGAARGGGRGFDPNMTPEERRKRMEERMASMTPEERERMQARMKEREAQGGGGAGGGRRRAGRRRTRRTQGGGRNAAAAGASAGRTGRGIAGGVDARDHASRAVRTTIDSLFAPLQTVETRGRAWLYEDKQLKSVSCASASPTAPTARSSTATSRKARRSSSTC